MFGSHRCRVCLSAYTVFLQNVLGRRSQKLFPQYFCMECQSVFHTSGYHEDDDQKKADFDYLFSVRDHHYAILAQLFLEIKTLLPHMKSMCEIGHGSGMFMKAARDFGVDPYGYEINPYCHSFVREELGISCSKDIFDGSSSRNYDLIASIMVFEHLESPRELFEAMVSSLNRDGAIYISVPFFRRELWPYLWTAGTNPADSDPDPFNDSDVHITHFSIEGMRRMGLSMGARSADYWVSKDVYHNSVGSYHGFLFKF